MLQVKHIMTGTNRLLSVSLCLHDWRQYSVTTVLVKGGVEDLLDANIDGEDNDT